MSLMYTTRPSCKEGVYKLQDDYKLIVLPIITEELIKEKRQSFFTIQKNDTPKNVFLNERGYTEVLYDCDDRMIWGFKNMIKKYFKKDEELSQETLKELQIKLLKSFEDEDIDYLKELSYNNWQFDVYALEYCCALGKLECVQYLHSIGLKTNDSTLIAARNGHLEVLKFLHTHFNQIKPNSMYLAAENGHFDIVKYIIEQNNWVKFFPDTLLWDEDVLLKIIKYIINNFSELNCDNYQLCVFDVTKNLTKEEIKNKFIKERFHHAIDDKQKEIIKYLGDLI